MYTEKRLAVLFNTRAISTITNAVIEVKQKLTVGVYITECTTGLKTTLLYLMKYLCCFGLPLDDGSFLPSPLLLDHTILFSHSTNVIATSV